jgi:hypothetical protein
MLQSPSKRKDSRHIGEAQGEAVKSILRRVITKIPNLFLAARDLYRTYSINISNTYGADNYIVAIKRFGLIQGSPLSLYALGLQKLLNLIDKDINNNNNNNNNDIDGNDISSVNDNFIFAYMDDVNILVDHVLNSKIFKSIIEN